MQWLAMLWLWFIPEGRGQGRGDGGVKGKESF